MEKPPYREIELVINRQTVVDQIAAQLYALNIADEQTEHITDIQFSDLFGPSEHVPIKVGIKRQQRVVII